MSRFKASITNEEVAAMPKCAFPGIVEIIDTKEKAVEACAYLMQKSIIGFDTETRPSFKAGVSNKTALLQLSSEERCFLFRLSQMKMCRDIIRVLESANVVKVGAAVRDDIKGLQKLRQFHPKGFVDLQSLAGEWGIEEKSVRKLAGVVLGSYVSKAQRLSNWGAADFTPAQLSNAATDAGLLRRILQVLSNDPE